MVPPVEFIPLAEETGLILPIGAWVLKEACRQLRAWHEEGHAHLRIAVNLSAKQFQEKNLLEVVKHALAHAQLEPRFLELELTETAVMQDAVHSAAVSYKDNGRFASVKVGRTSGGTDVRTVVGFRSQTYDLNALALP